MDRKGNVERWEGGRIHVQKDGRRLYILERQVEGRRYHISTRCHSEGAAYEQLRRFEADPANYAPGGKPEAEAILLTDELVEAYRDWMVVEKENTRRHSNQMANRLAEWMEDLDAVDLRKATLRDHLAPSIAKRKTCRPARIIAIKGFYAWLRKEKHLLTSASDPTLDLPVPQADPAKHRRRKALARPRVKRALLKLQGAQRDCLLLLMATGWHVTELERFIRARDSEIVMRKARQRGHGRRVLATLVTKHKGGEPTRTPIVYPEHLAAAERLRERGQVPRKLNLAVQDACRAVAVEPFTLGVLRHSVATWAHEDGASIADIAEFLGHKDPRTTRRFYSDVAEPTKTVPLFRVVLGGRP